MDTLLRWIGRGLWVVFVLWLTHVISTATTSAEIAQATRGLFWLLCAQLAWRMAWDDWKGRHGYRVDD